MGSIGIFSGGGSSVPTTFFSPPSPGVPTLPVGTGTFGGGAAPDFQGTSAIGVNMAAGYSGILLSTQVAGVGKSQLSQSVPFIGSARSFLSYPQDDGFGMAVGTPGAAISINKAAAWSDSRSTCFVEADTVSSTGSLMWSNPAGTSLNRIAFLGTAIQVGQGSFNTFPAPTANQLFTALNLVPASVPLVAQGAALQTADLIRAQDSGVVNQFGVANVGTGAAPVWALRTAPVANAASMAQAHAGGASTGKAIQVVDNAGVTIGWLQLLA